MRKLFTIALAATAVTTAQAQTDYPNKPIRLITIASPGGGGDTIARLIAEKMAPLLKTTFVVDNRPGAGGALAMDAVAKATPDGYTIGLGGFSSNVLLPIVRAKMSYDAVKDFAPIAQIGTASILMIASNDVPANNTKELVALAKKSPDGLMYASWGIGSTGHFCGELLNQRSGTKLTHVPYKGVGPIMNDIMGGQIKLAFVDMATGSPLVKSGRVKAIGSCVMRSPSLPEVRGFAEDGVDFTGKSPLLPMWAFYAPAGTPKPIVDKLGVAMKQVVEQPEVKAKLLELGVNADFVPGEAYRELLAAGIPQWREIATKSNIKADE
jgi:tripartite-type tricarboxylate transporter receptor subunit TctC